MIEIIPAIDVLDEKCVRLAQGDFLRATVYSDDPVQTAKDFESAGVGRLHIVDLDGAKNGRVTNLKVLERIATATDLVIDFGGGIKTDDDIADVFNAGASVANMGSIAVKEPDRFSSWIDKYGGEKILLGADVRDGHIAIDGWQTSTRLGVISFLRDWFARGLRQAFVTDIARDGMSKGPAVDLYKKIVAELPDLRLIASGGVNSVDDVVELERAGCKGVIIGRAIYEGKIDLVDVVQRAPGNTNCPLVT
jgi:phosphoribosylformimino-5-aminoimidazole carboxamide ribotide isomerase